MCWPKSGVCNVDGYQVYHAGNDDAKYLGGVVIVVTNHRALSVQTFILISDRVVLVRFVFRPSLCADIIE